MEKEVVYNRVVNWLKENYQFEGELTEEIDFVNVGIIDSFGLVELVLLIEDIGDFTIPVDRFDYNSIRSLKSIYENFFLANTTQN